MSEPIPVNAAHGKAPASVLILTRNEEANLGECLASVGWAAEAFVVDSLSTDRTVGTARKSIRTLSRATRTNARGRSRTCPLPTTGS